MPLLNTFGAGGVRSLGRALGIDGRPYWVNNLTLYINPYDVTSDAAGNFYIVGGATQPSPGYVGVIKLNKNGTILWQNRYGNDTDGWGGSRISIDSSGNIYVAGGWQNGGGTRQGMSLLKINNSGALQWVRTLENPGWFNSVASVKVDPLNDSNIYLVGAYQVSGGVSQTLIAKYNASGIIQWQRFFGAASYPGFNVRCLAGDVAVSLSGDIYITGFAENIAGNGTNLLLLKYDASGTYQWNRVLGPTGGGARIVLDNSNNIYMLCTSGGGSLISKYSDTGVIQWQRTFGNGNGMGTDTMNAIQVAGTTIYIAGYTWNASDSNPLYTFVAYSLTGDLLWQRYFTSPRGGISGISVFAGAAICWVGSSSPFNRECRVGRFPIDTSKFGTYTSGITWTYAAASRVNGNGAATDTTISWTSKNGTESEYASTLSATATAYSPDLINI
jgi:hypothetical protein